VDDAPERFISGASCAIVGVELLITRIEAKTKLGQNRLGQDVDGVVAGGVWTRPRCLPCRPLAVPGDAMVTIVHFIHQSSCRRPGIRPGIVS
jgi:hypothetical protein